MLRTTRPVGQHTRGKTAINRLRRADVFVALAMPSVLLGNAPLAIDLGFGARPWTALELAERWRRVNPTLRVLGVEIDAERVAEALPFADPPFIDFRVGGFDLASILGTERARVVRCMNVLRQYDEAEVEAALARVAEGIEPEGLLLEGTCSPSGRVMAFDLYRRAPEGLKHRALVFSTNFRAPTEPGEYRTIAPKRLIHRMLDDAPQRFFADWEQAAAMARCCAPTGTPRHWAATARTLSDFGWPVDLRPRLLERGFLKVRSELR